MPITIPQYHELMWPVLTALKELGGSATVQEMYEQVVKDEGFSEDQQQVLTKDKRMSEIQYRLGENSPSGDRRYRELSSWCVDYY